MNLNTNSEPCARYRVEHFNASNVWAPTHEGFFDDYSAALNLKLEQPFCRILVDHFGNGAWEEVESLPVLTEDWEAEKREALASFKKNKPCV